MAPIQVIFRSRDKRKMPFDLNFRKRVAWNKPSVSVFKASPKLPCDLLWYDPVQRIRHEIKFAAAWGGIKLF